MHRVQFVGSVRALVPRAHPRELLPRHCAQPRKQQSQRPREESTDLERADQVTSPETDANSGDDDLSFCDTSDTSGEQRSSPWAVAKLKEGKDADAETAATELIFNLYNRGSGWGEEIVPHVTMQQRKIRKLQVKGSDPWEVSTPLSQPLPKTGLRAVANSLRRLRMHTAFGGDTGHCTVEPIR